MKIYFLELPGWHFEARELSVGVFEITGSWGDEKRVERTGSDTTALLEQCHRDALEVVEGGRMKDEGGRRKAEGEGKPNILPRSPGRGGQQV